MAITLSDLKDKIVIAVAAGMVAWMGFITRAVMSLPEKQVALDHVTSQLLKESESHSEALKGVEDTVVSLKTQILLLNEKHYREMLSLSLSSKYRPDTTQVPPAPGDTE